jgi:glycosyltransferase involved in cell wall biosynthesis
MTSHAHAGTTVIIPAYNVARYLADAIESALGQTHPPLEVIVIDDGSTDETPQVLARYAGRIIGIRQRNAGLAAARNRGLAAARGEFIAFLDADDAWYPNALAVTTEALQRQEGADIVIGAWDSMDCGGRVLQRRAVPPHVQRHLQMDARRTLALGNRFPVGGLLIRRRCFACCGLFDQRLQALEDWELWLRFAAHQHRLIFVPEVVLRYRRHAASMSLDLPRMRANATQIVEKLLADPDLADLRQHISLGVLALLVYLAEQAQDLGAMLSLATEADHLARHAPRHAFAEVVALMDAEQIKTYRWLAARELLRRGRRLEGMTGFFELAWNRPLWCLRKVARACAGRAGFARMRGM